MANHFRSVDQCQTINVENLQTIANSPRRAIQQQPLFFTRSTCSHTILNSPSSTCRLHVVSLNQRQSLNDEMISSQNQNNNQPPLPPLQQQTHHTELSSTSLLSSPKSPCQISFGCNANNNNNNNGHQIDSKTIRCLSYPNSYSLQSPTMLSMKTTTATSSTSRTSSIRSRSMQFFLTNNGGHSGGGGGENNSKSFHSIVGCCWCWSIDWLKFGFKLLLLFTILFWLFSIITWIICNHEESSDSGIGHSSIGHQHQQQQRKPQEITVIQIDNDHQHHRRH
ncbi:hypothetical protein HUG17_7534 [Dermatophagoides farinae]|uniref:Uncharacterized protein n=1 Tax=Dermatophagoides farinae TaxID=6954 RepID=A0A9D4SD61_DERFA|nr:hypothetical protein HUG17_7534 [Dermatophagoides farinae]